MDFWAAGIGFFDNSDLATNLDRKIWFDHNISPNFALGRIDRLSLVIIQTPAKVVPKC